MVLPKKEIDIEKATIMVKRYFQKIHDDLGLLGFKVESVDKNTTPNVWKVRCSFFPSIGSEKRSYYLVRVNIKTGIMDVREEKTE